MSGQTYPVGSCPDCVELIGGGCPTCLAPLVARIAELEVNAVALRRAWREEGDSAQRAIARMSARIAELEAKVAELEHEKTTAEDAQGSRR